MNGYASPLEFDAHTCQVAHVGAIFVRVSDFRKQANVFLSRELVGYVGVPFSDVVSASKSSLTIPIAMLVVLATGNDTAML